MRTETHDQLVSIGSGSFPVHVSKGKEVFLLIQIFITAIYKAVLGTGDKAVIKTRLKSIA